MTNCPEHDVSHDRLQPVGAGDGAAAQRASAQVVSTHAIPAQRTTSSSPMLPDARTARLTARRVQPAAFFARPAPDGDRAASGRVAHGMRDKLTDQLRERYPDVLIWYGEATGRYWAMPLWPETQDELIEAADPAELASFLAARETLNQDVETTMALPVPPRAEVG